MRAIRYVQQNYEHVRFWDQDGLNAVIAGRWGELDLKWNQQTDLWKDNRLKRELTEDAYRDLVDNPFIIHYSTGNKPWIYGCAHPKVHVFFYYLNLTAWSNWQPRKRFKDTYLGTYLKNLKNRFSSLEQYWTKLKKLKESV